MASTTQPRHGFVHFICEYRILVIYIMSGGKIGLVLRVSKIIVAAMVARLDVLTESIHLVLFPHARWLLCRGYSSDNLAHNCP